MANMGARFWNQFGIMTLDSQRRVPHILGLVETHGNDGMLTDAMFSFGTPIHLPVLWEMPTFGVVQYSYPAITMSGNTMIWTYQGSGNRLSATIMYGFR